MMNSTASPISACLMPAEGADWREVSRIILRIDPEREPARARPAFESHLERAKWVADSGYRRLRQGWPSAAERARVCT